MKNYICVYDFETDGVDPTKCEPVQVAACMIHPQTLEIVDDSYFSSFMRPVTIDNPEYFEDPDRLKTIQWHANNYGISVEEVKKTWLDAPEQSQVWNDFYAYTLKYNKNQARKSHFNAPIRAGINIKRFDNVIADRLCKDHGIIMASDGEQKMFNRRDNIDILDFCLYWFENLPEPQSYAMDNLRKFFGMDGELAHDALKDVKDEARIIQKFFQLHRRLAPKIQFKGSLSGQLD